MGMLVLSRRVGESIIFEDDHGRRVTITVTDIRGDKVRIGVDAPREWPVHRDEIQALVDEGRGRK